MVKQIEKHIPSLEAMAAFATQVALQAKKGDIIALHGDLGAGKTTFVRFFINALMGKEEVVVSPTFTLLQHYETPLLPVWHVDAYRLEKQEEALDLGLEDAYSDGVALIEWAEKIKAILPPCQCELFFLFGKGEEGRIIKAIIPESWHL